MRKISVTISIDDELWNKYEKIILKKEISKSNPIKKFIEKYVEDNKK